MSDAMGIYALWYREIKVFFREKSRIVSSVVNPILWLLVIGGGIGSAFSLGKLNYQSFIFPGVLMQVAIFSSVFFGVYIVWDKKIDFLKEVLISPISRTSIFFGKVLGGSTDSLIQTTLLLIIGVIFVHIGILQGINFTATTLLLSFFIIILSSFGLVSMGLLIGSQMESPEGFQMIGSFLIFPMFFLSGALFPIDNLPSWLAPFTFLNPMTYPVDALRGVLLGASHFNVFFDIGVIGTFSVVMILIGSYAFKNMKV